MPVPMPCLWPCAVPCGTALLAHALSISSFIPPLPPVASCKRAKAQWNRALRGLRCQSFPGPAGRTSTPLKNYRLRELTAPLTFGVCQYDMPRCSIGIRIELQR